MSIIDNFTVLPRKLTLDPSNNITLDVTTERIADDSVSTIKIQDDAVTTAKILNANITTAKIADGDVTNVKLEHPSLTIGTTELTLGNSSTTFAGLTVLTWANDTTTINATGTTTNQAVITDTIDTTTITPTTITTPTVTIGANEITTPTVTIGVNEITTPTVTIGVNEITTEKLDISFDISNNTTIDTLGTNTNIIISPNGTGVINVPSGYETRGQFGDDSLVNKKYVDAVASGLNLKENVRAATTANLSANYYNGALNDGIGATLTSTVSVALSIDGITPFVDTLGSEDRVLVKDQTAKLQNGIYIVTTAGSGATPWVLTRATDADESAEIPSGTFVFVTEGTVNQDKGFAASHEDNPVIGTDDLQFDTFSGQGGLNAGEALDKDVDTLNVLYDDTTIGLTNTQDPLTNNQLFVKTDGIIDDVTIGTTNNQLFVKDGSINTTQITDDAVDQNKLKNVVSLTIYNSSGTAIKTIYGAGA